ncbi:hypothetical protein M3Y99_00387000 [Aphelenchoides fujianensis]|nr:hypothetical protein M3Y99_00387000 [Aphelenchoides fujianensis]
MVEQYEEDAKTRPPRVPRTDRKLTPIAFTQTAEGVRTSQRERRATFKRLLLEKLPADPLAAPAPQRPREPNGQPADRELFSDRRSSEHSTTPSTEAPNEDDDAMAPCPNKRSRGSNVHLQIAMQTSPLKTRSRTKRNSTGSQPAATRGHTPRSARLSNARSRAKDDEDAPVLPKFFGIEFPLHPWNGLIGEKYDELRMSKLVHEMDESLLKLEGFLLTKTATFAFNRLVLIAKRHNGMVAYVRLSVPSAPNFFVFECVPLEVVFHLHRSAVRDYLKECVRREFHATRRRRALQQKPAEEVEAGLADGDLH